MSDTLKLILGADGRFRWHTEGRTLPFICGGDGDAPDPPEQLTVPEDLGPEAVDAAELDRLHTAVAAALDALRDQAEADPGSITSDDATLAEQYAQAYAALDAEVTRRATEQGERTTGVLDTIGAVRPPVAADPGDGEGTEGDAGDGTGVPADGDAGEVPAEPAPAEGAAPVPEPVAAASRRQPITVPAVAARPTLNPSMSLAEIAAEQQTRTAQVPGAAAPRMGQPVRMTSANGIPNFDGVALDDDLALADAFAARASNMSITRGQGAPMPVAQIVRDFEHVLEEGSTLEEADRAFRELIGTTPQSRGAMEALVAAGGWCAPSEIDYSFFNVAAPGGLVDLPTIGIRRGGLRWPISLTLADFFQMSGAPASGTPSNATMPWEWTEADDILAATGSPTKSCLRPPCPSFDEERLRVWGLCVLAGNLTEAAYPELIRHFIMLVNIAHARVMNRRHIAQMVADPIVTAVTPTAGAASSATTHTLGAAALEATHLRYKYGAPLGAVMEYGLPAWSRALMREDLARRNGWDNLASADAYLMSLFDARDIRAQWLEDWQNNTGWNGGPTLGADTPPTTWPTSFLGLMYFPGSYFLGRGFNLNLGVVRDSVLNEANDHTAAWSEEGTLVGARGPEALLITNSPVYPNGVSGAQTASVTASA